MMTKGERKKNIKKPLIIYSCQKMRSMIERKVTLIIKDIGHNSSILGKKKAIVAKSRFA